MQTARLIARFPSGTIQTPPSKSDSHRALICAALAALGGGVSHIHGLGRSQDIDATQGGMRVLGARFTQSNGALTVAPGKPLDEVVDCGESGSTLRFLIPIAAALRGETRLVGRGKLLERPLDIYERLFADRGITLAREPGGLVLRGRLPGGRYELPGDVSSQFVSGLLFALPLVGGGEVALTTPLESRGYVDMTLAAMRAFGVAVACEDSRFAVAADQRYRAADYTVEADYSQAAFLLAAAALGRGVHCTGLNPGSLQGDRRILEVLRQMGADVVTRDGVTSVQANMLRAVDVDVREIPDLAPPIAALCCFCEGESHITGAARLRIKECDRLAALASELGKLGANIREGADSLTILGSPSLPGGAADSWNDHRIAMAVAVAAIRCTGPVTLTGWEAVAKSYPHFWEDFECGG